MKLKEFVFEAGSFILLISPVITALASVILLWIYRSAVIHAMNKISDSDTKIREITDYTIRSIDNSLSYSSDPSELIHESGYLNALRSMKIVTYSYITGGLFYAFVLTMGWMIAAKDGFPLTRFLWLFVCFCWPSVIVINIINPVLKSKFTINYLAILLIIGGSVLILGSTAKIKDLIQSWLAINIAPTILIGLFLNKRVRAVGPLVLVIAVSGITGAVFFLSFVGDNSNLLFSFVKVADLLKIGASALFAFFFLFGFTILGYLGWQILRWLGFRYLRKRMSDQSITLDSLWLVFGIIQSFALVNDAKVLIVTGLVAFIVYKSALLLCFSANQKRNNMIIESRQLLLLRVFSLGRRSEDLFNRFSKVWLFRGNINLIAGPDLVKSLVEPHEFLDFMGGHLSRQFVSGREDLEQRIKKLDKSSDPDGRYRVNEFFCHANTWQMAMQRLAQISDSVMMDLRSFCRQNAGCIYELQYLLNNVPLKQIVLVIDKSTDLAFLNEAVSKINASLALTMDRVRKDEKSVLVFNLGNERSTDVTDLLMLMFAIRRQYPGN